jgi:hypothetical protein
VPAAGSSLGGTLVTVRCVRVHTRSVLDGDVQIEGGPFIAGLANVCVFGDARVNGTVSDEQHVLW